MDISIHNPFILILFSELWKLPLLWLLRQVWRRSFRNRRDDESHATSLLHLLSSEKEGKLLPPLPDMLRWQRLRHKVCFLFKLDPKHYFMFIWNKWEKRTRQVTQWYLNTLWWTQSSVSNENSLKVISPLMGLTCIINLLKETWLFYIFLLVR